MVICGEAGIDLMILFKGEKLPVVTTSAAVNRVHFVPSTHMQTCVRFSVQGIKNTSEHIRTQWVASLTSSDHHLKTKEISATNCTFGPKYVGACPNNFNCKADSAAL